MNKLLIMVLLLAFLFTEAWADCDADAGRKAFNKCIACHSIEKDTHLMGPSLYAIFGRRAGSAAGFTFSQALVEADFIWDEKTMDAFLERPMQNIPGTTMPFGGLRKLEQRQAINCYLAAAND